LASLLLASLALGVDEVRADYAYAWGYNGFGQLGNGTTSSGSATPNPVLKLTGNVTSVAAGGSSGLAVQNGGVYAWGSNMAGQLGDGTTLDRSLPFALTGDMSSHVTAVAGGQQFSLAVRNGGVYAWGNNAAGQLGDGTTLDRSTPYALTGLLSSNVNTVAAGQYFSLALRSGALYAWGLNSSGQLGDGTTTNSFAPVAVSGLGHDVTAISAGPYFGLAVHNGGVVAWGNNAFGQLGDSTTIDRSTPVALPGVLASGVTAVAAGFHHSLAVQNGNVYAWGENSQYGALGDGTTTSHALPELIDPTDLHNIIAVAAGQQTSYALSSDGSIWDWGYNASGQLGLGNNLTDHYLTPQHLLPPSGYRFTSIDVDANATGFALATLAPVPEPSGLALTVIAIAGLAAWGRRQSRR